MKEVKVVQTSKKCKQSVTNNSVLILLLERTPFDVDLLFNITP